MLGQGFSEEQLDEMERRKDGNDVPRLVAEVRALKAQLLVATPSPRFYGAGTSGGVDYTQRVGKGRG